MRMARVARRCCTVPTMTRVLLICGVLAFFGCGHGSGTSTAARHPVAIDNIDASAQPPFGAVTLFVRVANFETDKVQQMVAKFLLPRGTEQILSMLGSGPPLAGADPDRPWAIRYGRSDATLESTLAETLASNAPSTFVISHPALDPAALTAALDADIRRMCQQLHPCEPESFQVLADVDMVHLVGGAARTHTLDQLRLPAGRAADWLAQQNPPVGIFIDSRALQSAVLAEYATYGAAMLGTDLDPSEHSSLLNDFLQELLIAYGMSFPAHAEVGQLAVAFDESGGVEVLAHLTERGLRPFQSPAPQDAGTATPSPRVVAQIRADRRYEGVGSGMRLNLSGPDSDSGFLDVSTGFNQFATLSNWMAPVGTFTTAGTGFSDSRALSFATDPQLSPNSFEVVLALAIPSDEPVPPALGRFRRFGAVITGRMSFVQPAFPPDMVPWPALAYPSPPPACFIEALKHAASELQRRTEPADVTLATILDGCGLPSELAEDAAALREIATHRDLPVQAEFSPPSFEHLAFAITVLAPLETNRRELIRVVSELGFDAAEGIADDEVELFISNTAAQSFLAAEIGEAEVDRPDGQGTMRVPTLEDYTIPARLQELAASVRLLAP